MIQHTVETPYLVGEAHFYSTEIEGELVLFDTGPPFPKAMEILKSSIDLKKLRHVFVTHCHVDHLGLAGFLEERTQAQIYLSRLDDLKLRYHEEHGGAIDHLLREAGFDEAFGKRLQAISTASHGFSTAPKRYQILEDSDVPDWLKITPLSCPGHSQSDTVFVHDGCAVTGDLLLRNVFQTPILEVDLYDVEKRYRNYPAYCESLLKLASLEGLRILPGHKFSVDGVLTTILFYVRKLLERGGKVKNYADAQNVSDVVKLVFGDSLVDPFVIYMKVSEIYFMRDFLANPELLKSSLERIGLFGQVSEQYQEVVG